MKRTKISHPENLIHNELLSIFNENVSKSKDVLLAHGHDESWLEDMLPDYVCYPNNTDQISKTVDFCRRFQVPLIPFGAGTSVEGNILAPYGGVSIDLSNMKKIISINTDDRYAIVEPGVTRELLNSNLKQHGLFFSVDPGANATLGGMAATCASGTNTVLYGSMRENVMALKATTGRGEQIVAGCHAPKSSVGYDLKNLFVGSEGTLGIITELTIRLRSVPPDTQVAVIQYSDVQGAIKSACDIVQTGIRVAKVELLDELAIECIKKYGKINSDAKPTLFIELAGFEQENTEAIALCREIADGYGAVKFKFAKYQEDRTELWKARSQALYAVKSMRPNCRVFPTDVCVPLTKLADYIKETKFELSKTDLFAPLLGHVGDGNFHLLMLVDVSSPIELQQAQDFSFWLVQKALSIGGTCSGEHGVGLGKRKHMLSQYPESISLMRDIKKLLDPDNILNPGKLFV